MYLKICGNCVVSISVHIENKTGIVTDTSLNSQGLDRQDLFVFCNFDLKKKTIPLL